jgi:hypothetical protein
MGLYIKTSSGAWSPAVVARVKTAASTWSPVLRGFVKTASNAWSQFWPAAANAYTFSFGNTVHIGTNGYIALDSGQSTTSIASTTGRVLGILPADLELNSIRYAADSSKFYVFYRGKRLGGTNFEIEYEVHFTDGQDYALIKLVAFPSTTYSRTGYYVSGSNTGYSGITTTRTVGAEYRVYFGTTAAFTTSFTEYGTSTHPVWLSQGSLTSGTADSGYISVVGSQGSSPQAPTSVTASGITGNSATVSWSAVTNANAGMSAIQSYDYSINGGSSWTSNGTNISVNILGLSSSTPYTVLVRANNYFFTGTNYGSVPFNTLAGGPTITNLTAVAPTTTSTQLVVVTVSWTSTNQASYFLNVQQAFVANYLDYGTTETSSSQSDSGSNFNVYSGASVSISLTVYNGPGQTGDSATSTITYTPPIQITPTISNLAASSITKTGATLGWTSTNQATYSITGLPSSYSGTTADSRAVSGLSEDTSYTATVTVTSSSGDTASENVTFRTLATITPTISDVTASSIGFTGATISWTSTNQASYSITGLPNSYTGTTGTSRSIISLVKGTSYTATVTVTSSSGDTASGSVTFTTLIPNISSITMTPGGNSTPYMTATWAATNTASVYFLAYRSSSSAVNSPINTLINSGGSTTNGSTIITNSGGLNFYYQFIIQPWSQTNGTGESGNGRSTGVKRNTVTGGPTTYTF